MTNENAKPLDGITRFEPTIVEDGDGDPVGEMVKAYLGDWIKFSDARQYLSEGISERDEARGAAVKANRTVERMRGLLNEAQMHLLNRPMSLRAYADPKTLAARIETVLKETL